MLRGLKSGRRGLSGFRQAEVEHLDGAVRADFDVRRLQITMDDALFVRRLQRLGYLFRDQQRLIERDRSAGGSLRQVLALDELHDEGAHAARFLEAVNVRDVRMVQRRERLGFPCEPGEPFGIVSERVRQDFERDIAIELRVASLIDLSHPTFADRRSDFVHAEAGTRGEGQMMWIIRLDQAAPTR